MATPAASRARRTAAVPEGTAIVYVSPWCMHCDAVTEQLRDLEVPFIERNVFDDRFRAEYAAKMRSIGRRPPAVPLVELHDRLILGLDNISISSLVHAHRAGNTDPRPQEHPGATTPPTPRKRVHEPGAEVLREPVDAPAILYVSSDYCPHCGPARAFLRARDIAFVERDIVNPKAADQLMDLHLTFHQRGSTVPSLEVHGRGLIGFDDDGIDAILAWRRIVNPR